MTHLSHPGGPLCGSITLPGDKSISHRALIFSALSQGPCSLRGLLNATDVNCTADALRAMGVSIERVGEHTHVHAPDGLREPCHPIDCGNSGTTMRLLSGVLASQPFFSVLVGDSSLQSRPMGRVITPLTQMGARFFARDQGQLAPLAIQGGTLQAIDYVLPMASAQVKSALLLAGLHSGVRLKEPAKSRDHTERLFRAMGVPLNEEDGWLSLPPRSVLQPINQHIPADLSAAAFWLVAGSIIPGSHIVLKNVGLNPTRAGVIDVLRLMGAQIAISDLHTDGPEPFGTITVQHRPLKGIEISGELALRSLDELPILSVAAAFAQGETRVRDAGELRHKESDRIHQTCKGLDAIGVKATEHPDGLSVIGQNQPAGGGRVDAEGDHRLAMAFAVAGAACRSAVTIDHTDGVQTSYPAFFTHLESLRA